MKSGASLRERQAALIRDAILEGLADRLDHDDPDDIVMPQVAAEAGVSLRTLYRYFPTREAMFDAVGDHVVAGLGLPRRIEGADDIAPVFLESAKRGAFRPAWQELLPLPQPGDTLKFWKSDRWGRSAADVLATVNELRDRGIKVVATRYAQWRQRRAPMSSREEPFSAPVT